MRKVTTAVLAAGAALVVTAGSAAAGARAQAGQSAVVLRVTVTLVDPGGRPAPVPGHALLVSDNPPTASPRRVVTAPDGTVVIRLRPGSYIVESDEPVVAGGKLYRWTQMLEVAAGRDTTLELTSGNADVEDAVAAPAAVSGAPASPPAEDETSLLLARWQESVVTLWTPAAQALGVLVDARGLVVTTRRAIGETSSAEVQLTPTVKVSGRVVVASPALDVAVLWIDPAVVGSRRPVPTACAGPRAPLAAGQELLAIDGERRGQRRLLSGTLTRLESAGLGVDFTLEPRSAGGPVFAADGRLVGLTSLTGDGAGAARGETRVVRADEVCVVLASAEQRLRETAAPSGALLPVEPLQPFPAGALAEASQRRAVTGPYQVTSSDFDVSFITPVLVDAARQRWGGGRDRSRDLARSDSTQDRYRLLTDFGRWTEYVADTPPVLLVRVTPRFVEGFWTMVGRAAASTQGVSIPPIRRFKPGFARMRAYCGAAEVTPIHAFTLEQRISEDDAIREGLYVFDPGALGPPCGTVRLVLFSEKAPDRGDSKTVDPGVLEQVWRDFAPFRDALPASSARPRGGKP